MMTRTPVLLQVRKKVPMPGAALRRMAVNRKEAARSLAGRGAAHGRTRVPHCSDTAAQPPTDEHPDLRTSRPCGPQAFGGVHELTLSYRGDLIQLPFQLKKQVRRDEKNSWQDAQPCNPEFTGFFAVRSCLLKEAAVESEPRFFNF